MFDIDTVTFVCDLIFGKKKKHIIVREWFPPYFDEVCVYLSVDW